MDPGAASTSAPAVLPQALATPVHLTRDPELYGVVERINLPSLQVTLRFHGLWQEAALLVKLLYKNRNQHRRAHFYQKLQEVRRLLTLLSSLHLHALPAELYAAAQRSSRPTTAAAAAAATASGPSFKRARAAKAQEATGPASFQLPSAGAVAWSLRRMLAGCQLLEALHPAILSASVHLAAQLSMTYFMPLCLTCISVLARMRVLSACCLLDLARSYNALIDLLPLLPGAPEAADATNSAANSTSAAATGRSDGIGAGADGVEASAMEVDAVAQPGDTHGSCGRSSSSQPRGGSDSRSARDGSNGSNGTVAPAGAALPQLLGCEWKGQRPLLTQSLFSDADSLQQQCETARARYGIGTQHVAASTAAGALKVSDSDRRSDAAGAFGVAISREAFQQQQQHQQQRHPQRQQKRHEKAPKSVPPTTTTIGPPPFVVHDDRTGQHMQGAVSGNGSDSSAVPLYNRLDLPGFSLDLGITPAPAPRVLPEAADDDGADMAASEAMDIDVDDGGHLPAAAAAGIAAAEAAAAAAAAETAAPAPAVAAAGGAQATSAAPLTTQGRAAVPALPGAEPLGSESWQAVHSRAQSVAFVRVGAPSSSGRIGTAPAVRQSTQQPAPQQEHKKAQPLMSTANEPLQLRVPQEQQLPPGSLQSSAMQQPVAGGPSPHTGVSMGISVENATTTSQLASASAKEHPQAAPQLPLLARRKAKRQQQSTPGGQQLPCSMQQQQAHQGPVAGAVADAVNVAGAQSSRMMNIIMGAASQQPQPANTQAAMQTAAGRASASDRGALGAAAAVPGTPPGAAPSWQAWLQGGEAEAGGMGTGGSPGSAMVPGKGPSKTARQRGKGSKQDSKAATASNDPIFDMLLGGS